MGLDRTVAHFVTHRRPLVFASVGLLVAACLLVIVFGLHFDSDILDLLPKDFDSVQALKTSDREFTNARQIVFALWNQSEDADLDQLTTRFTESLKKEPWVVRVTAGAPVESADGVEDLQRYLAVPLLLNLPPEAFGKALQQLQPDRIAGRLHELRQKMEVMGMAEMKLNFDALGLVQEALRPMAGSFSSDSSQSFVSEDGSMHLVFVETNQSDIGPHDCQAVMRKVDAFKARFLAACPGPKPTVLITGRNAYVDQISRAMRFDIVSTLLGSVLLVSLVFYVGFRRVWPLVALMHVLLICCLVAIAAGGLIFHELNLITIGLCSILVGLGVDFGMLLYGSYQSQRNAGVAHEEAIARSLKQLGEGIFIGSLTTAAAFVSFIFSGCAAFAQLGGLIAIGIVVASLLDDDGLLCHHQPPQAAGGARSAFRGRQALRRRRIPEPEADPPRLHAFPPRALRHRGRPRGPPPHGGRSQDAGAALRGGHGAAHHSGSLPRCARSPARAGGCQGCAILP